MLLFSVAYFLCQSVNFVCSYYFSSVSVDEWPPSGK